MIPTDIVDKCVEFAGAMAVLTGAMAAASSSPAARSRFAPLAAVRGCSNDRC